jgi:hypothetical protein
VTDRPPDCPPANPLKLTQIMNVTQNFSDIFRLFQLNYCELIDWEREKTSSHAIHLEFLVILIYKFGLNVWIESMMSHIGNQSLQNLKHSKISRKICWHFHSIVILFEKLKFKHFKEYIYIYSCLCFVFSSRRICV